MTRRPPAGDRPAVVAVGGGHGLARTLEALQHLELRPTAVVTVADDGGSSGRLRRQHGIMALGDMRMALETLAGDDRMARLFGHRFGEGDLDGHALGNLALLALVEQHDGDVVAALAEAGALLGCRGRVLPCTTDAVTLVAEIDGTAVEGQVAIATTDGRHGAVWLEPRQPAACADAVEAIAAADLLVLGPGSLYTSVIPNLLVPGLLEAVAASAAPVVYVANLTWQPGETGGMDLQAHVEALLAHLPDRRVDVVVHDGPRADGSGEPIGTRLAHDRVGRVLAADLATRRPDGTPVAAHDPRALASVLAGVVAGLAVPAEGP